MKNNDGGHFNCWTCRKKLVVIGERKGRKIYGCETKTCPRRKLLECTTCHKPREIWADDGDICGLCALAYLEGRLSLTPEQIARIEKYSGITLVKKPKWYIIGGRPNRNGKC